MTRNLRFWHRSSHTERVSSEANRQAPLVYLKSQAEGSYKSVYITLQSCTRLSQLFRQNHPWPLLLWKNVCYNVERKECHILCEYVCHVDNKLYSGVSGPAV
jgi:hypothetical protein